MGKMLRNSGRGPFDKKLVIWFTVTKLEQTKRSALKTETKDLHRPTKQSNVESPIRYTTLAYVLLQGCDKELTFHRT